MTITKLDLEGAIGFTSLASGVEVRCDWQSIEAAGVPRTSEIETKGAEGDVLDEFNRILNAADRNGSLECVVNEDYLLVRAKR